MRKWNHSLDLMIRTCERRVFLRSHFGCSTARKGSPRFRAFLVGQALDLPAWRGRLVHAAIHEWIIPPLRKGIWPDFHQVQTQTVELAAKQAEFSNLARYEHESANATGLEYCVLRDDLLGDGLSNEHFEETKTAVTAALNVLEEEHLDLLARVRKARKAYSEKPLRFKLDDDIFIEAIIDLMLCEPNGRCLIVDWKLWENTEGTARDQLQAYAFAVTASGWWPELKVDRFELVEANLINGDRTTYSASDEVLEEVEDRIFNGVDKLTRVFERPADDCSPMDFAIADSPGACQQCSVLEVCNGSVISARPASNVLPLELFSIGRAAGS